MARELVVTSDGRWCMYMGRLPQEDRKPNTPTHDEPTHALFIHDATWTCVCVVDVTSNHPRLPAFCVSTTPDADGRWIIAVDTSLFERARTGLFVFDPATATIVDCIYTQIRAVVATALAIVPVHKRRWTLDCCDGCSMVYRFSVKMRANGRLAIHIRHEEPVVGRMSATAMLSPSWDNQFRVLATSNGVRIYHRRMMLSSHCPTNNVNAYWSPGSWIQHPQTKQWRFASYNYQIRALFIADPDNTGANDELFLQKDWYGDAEVAWLSWDRLLIMRERCRPPRYEVDVYALSRDNYYEHWLLPVSAFVAYGLTNMKMLPGGRALLVYDEDEWQLGCIKHAVSVKLPLVWSDHVHARWAPVRFRVWAMTLVCFAQHHPLCHMPIEMWLLVFAQMYPMFTATYMRPRPILSALMD